MPSVLPDAVVTNVAIPVIINVLANDTGTNLTITSFSNPANGSLVFNGDKTFTYTPMAGFVGDDSFAYTVRDAQGTPANAEVTVSVVPNTGATIAIDDIVEVIAGAGVVIPVLANDMAAGDGALQIIAVSMPGHGAINVLPDQTIRYVPQDGFTGIDSFNYTVVDGQGSSATASVNVKVLTENRPPLAVDDSFTIEAGQPTLLVVLANDSDPEGGPLQIVGFTMPSQGSLVFNPDKTFTYTPAAGYLGNDQFTYTIRDNRGASAQASVSLSMRTTIETPVAADDQVTTEAGAPVTIDILANDTLPVGQQVNVVAVTLPFRGKLTFNPDKTISYTPEPGFVGTDDFTYTISNGKGGTAKARVTIEVTPANNANVYANGYAYRRRLAIPASSAKGASHTNFPLWVELAGSWLKSTANGGNVTSLDGHDLRFELEGGTKLAHELEHYDPVAGKLSTWVRLPELKADAATVLLLYYGNPEVAESETAPQAVWQDYLAVWHLPEASDSSGQGRGLVAQGSVQSTTLGLGAGSVLLNGDGVLKIDDASWLDGLEALSVQIRSKAASIGHDRGLLGAGAEAFTGDSDLFIRCQSAGFATGQPQNVIHNSIKTTAGKFRVSSKADTQSTDWQSLTLAWQSGDTEGSLHLDGKKIQPSFTTTNTGAGTTLIEGPLYIGASTQDSATGGWVGLIDEVRFRAAKLSDTWINAEHTNQEDPALFYGLGAEDAFGDSNESIVAVPFQRTTPAGENIDIDILTGAVGAESGSAIAIQGVSQPANGFASIFGNQVRYSPPSGFAGTDSFTYTLASNGKRSTATIAITVRSSVSNAEPWNTAQTIDIPSLTAMTTHNVANASQLSSAINTINTTSSAGHHIVLANGSYSGNYTIYAQGTQANPIVIRPANFLGATLTGTLTIIGSWVIVYGLNTRSINLTAATVSSTLYVANNCRVSRCILTGGNSINMAQGASYNCVDRCSASGGDGRLMEMRSGSTVSFRNCFIWNHLFDSAGTNSSNPAAFQATALNYERFNDDLQCLFAWNLVENNGYVFPCQAKGSGVTWLQNTLINTGQTSISCRHGRNHRVIANWLNGGIGIRGDDALILGNNNPTGRGDRYSANTGNIPTGSLGEPTTSLRPGWTFTRRAKFIGNTGPLRIGYESSQPYQPVDCLIEAHTGSISIYSGATGTIDRRNAAPSIEVPPAFKLTAAQVGPYS